jgi:hypothetical protein
MASALDTIAHVILPNVMKLKGAATLVSGLERRDVTPFAHVWEQTGVTHTPQVVAKERDVWRMGVLSMPTPSEMGEAHMVAFVAKKNDVGVARYFTLEYDFVLRTKEARTIIKEKDGANFTKRGNEGPPITGDFQVDASAFIDAIKRIVDPLPSEQPPPRDWS